MSVSSTIAVRVFAAIAGFVLAAGIYFATFDLSGWMGAGSYTTGPYLLAVVILGVARSMSRRRLRSAALRVAMSTAFWSSVPLLIWYASTSGLIDTKTAGRATQMIADLVILRSARKNSGRTPDVIS
jgi:hypothetical protein